MARPRAGSPPAHRRSGAAPLDPGGADGNARLTALTGSTVYRCTRSHLSASWQR
jgi:hypothetical protein